MNPAWTDQLLKFKPSLLKWTPEHPPPMIYQPKATDEKVTREVAFRINAIRETFEETGILLTLDDKIHDLDPEWRTKVHNKPSEFLALCQYLNTCPDIWCLKEWTDWLTPLHLKEKSRFDTIFYVACRDFIDKSTASEENKEVTEIQFLQPMEALKLHSEEKIWLAPPQFYELSRLASFLNYEELKNFSCKRAKNHGVQIWFPLAVMCSNGSVALYPGDDWYPTSPNYDGQNGPISLNKKDLTIEQFSEMSEKRNRTEMKSLHKTTINCNIVDLCGHRHPIISI